MSKEETTPDWALTKKDRDVQDYARTLGMIFENNASQFTDALKGHSDKPLMSVDFFKRLVLTAGTQSPKLFQCTHASVYKAALEIAQLQLEPNTPLQEAFLIPYKNGPNMECQVQIGKNGWIKLAHRTGRVRSVNALAVFEGEEFVWQPVKDPEIIHYPDVSIGQNAKLVAAYAWADLTDGTRIYEVLRKREIDARIRKFGGRSLAWRDYPDRMACRSAIKRLIKSRIPVNEYLYDKESLHPDTHDIDAVIIDTTATSSDDRTAEEKAESNEAAVQRVHAKIIELDGSRVDEETGEVVLRAPEPSKPDGVSKEATRNEAESITKITIKEFWTKISDMQKYWKCGPNRREILDLIKSDYGSADLKTLDNNQKQKILTGIEEMMRIESESKEANNDPDNVPF